MGAKGFTGSYSTPPLLTGGAEKTAEVQRNAQKPPTKKPSTLANATDPTGEIKKAADQAKTNSSST
jgi:hypothetical protein